MLRGAVAVVVQLLGVFLFLPSKVVSMSLTERHKEDEPILTRLQTWQKIQCLSQEYNPRIYILQLFLLVNTITRLRFESGTGRLRKVL